MKLRAGMPLVTKDSNRYSNAVVFDVKEGEHRNVVTIVTDFGNTLKFPSEEDVLIHWDISEGYKEYVQIAEEFGMEEELSRIFCLRERLDRQIELLTEVREGLK